MLGIIYTPMKKIVSTSLAILLLGGSLFLWHHFQKPSFTGNWIIVLGGSAKSSFVIEPDGSFICQTTGVSDRSDITYKGSIAIKDGVLTQTTTSDSQPRAQVPRVRSAHVIRMDVHELVVKWDNTGTETIFRKATR
jgi:hypothetical protein